MQGWDTAHKASVLAWLAHGVWVQPEQMMVEGIERITPADFHNAAVLGYGIKLLAIITRDFASDELSVRVHPTLLPAGSVIANVGGVFNGVSVTGDVVGTTPCTSAAAPPGCDGQRRHQRHRRRAGADSPEPVASSARFPPAIQPTAGGTPALLQASRLRVAAAWRTLGISGAVTTLGSRSRISRACWPAWRRSRPASASASRA